MSMINDTYPIVVTIICIPIPIEFSKLAIKI